MMRTMSARLAFGLALLFAGMPARADISAPSAARRDVLPVHSLVGPFPSIEAYCEKSRHEDDGPTDCAVVRRHGHTAAVVLRWGKQLDVVTLALQDDAGWWIDEGTILSDGHRGRGSFVIDALGDQPGSARLRGVQSTWWKPSEAELEHSDHDIYYCAAFEVRCWTRPKGPVCSDTLPVAGRRDCGLGGGEDEPKSFVNARWDWQQQIRDPADGTDIEVRRRAWRHFPANANGYGPWFEKVIDLARTLAGTHRRIDPTPR
jgi:hypothetical protein